MELSLIASKIYDDNRRIKFYSNELLALVKKEFRLNKITQYDYEKFINLLTCLNLQTDETRNQIDRFISLETKRHNKINLTV